MTTTEVQEAFTQDEIHYLEETASEHNMTVWELIHDAVMNAPY